MIVSFAHKHCKNVQDELRTGQLSNGEKKQDFNKNKTDLNEPYNLIREHPNEHDAHRYTHDRRYK